MMRKTTILLALAVAFLGVSLAFALPKDKQATKTGGTTPGGVTALKPLPAPANPVAVPGDFQAPILDYPEARGGVSRIIQSAVPGVTARKGIPEFHYNNNHLRNQVGIGPSGAVHVFYEVRTVPGLAADTAINDIGFYNAYDCLNSNAWFIDNANPARLGLALSGPGTIADPRIRQGDEPALVMRAGVPGAITRRYIVREDTPPASDKAFRGHAYFHETTGECDGLFTMDSTVIEGNPGNFDPVPYALNDSVIVVTWSGPQVSQVFTNYTTDRGLTWTAPEVRAFNTPWLNSTDITGSGNTFYIVGMFDPADPNAFTTTERPGYLKGTYNPLTGGITWGVKTEIVSGSFRQPGWLGNMIDIDAIMVGDVLHVLWTDWNGYDGTPFAGPGGAVWHANVLSDGTVEGPHKITNINISGFMPDRSYTLWGFMGANWPNVELVYGPNADDADPTMYALWSQPPDDGNFGWADYEQYGALGVYDIFCSASPNEGVAWDNPVNVTQTNNPDCDGTALNECYHEDHFSAAPVVSNDTIWIGAMVQKYPGNQELAVASGIPPDPGPFTDLRDEWVLYKAPARAPVVALRGDMDAPPTDTTKFFQIELAPRGASFSPTARLSNIGLVGFFVDSVKLEAGLNDVGGLITTHNAVAGTFVPVGGAYDFQVTLNPAQVDPYEVGTRSGNILAYIRSVAPAGNATLVMNITAHVVHDLCFNRKATIHSASNFTDVGNQGSIKDQGGNGMYHPFGLGYDDQDFFYDGGTWIAWDKAGDLRPNCVSGQRKVTRQIFGDKFLRCLADGYLDSTAGPGNAYYDLFLVSVATDQHDTSIAYKSIWEQSTHPDSSAFLLQTTKVINIGSTPIDSIAMGVLYDVDVEELGVTRAQINVGGDTTVNTLGRDWWLGYISGSDLSIDSCSPGGNVYGFVVVPGSIGNPGDLVRPRGASVYEQAGFSYELDCGNPFGGDSLAQRFSWYLDVLTSTRDRDHDTLTGVYEDTAGLGQDSAFICGSNATGPPWAADMGYMTIAKKVYNLPVNGGGNWLVGRYGMDALGALASGVDTIFSGVGESYTVIHVAVVEPAGLGALMTNAVTAINWYVNHSNKQTGPRQTRIKGDLNDDGNITAADVVEELNFAFLNDDIAGGKAIPVCVGDVNSDGGITAADVVTLLNGAFLGTGCPNCRRPCV
jgi:hypothetical protein